MSLALLAATAPRTQCTPQWLPGDGLPGTNGPVYATLHWDPDDVGPLPPVVVLAGSFTLAGNVPANNIATWDPATGTWAALGAGCDATVRALTSLPGGSLFAGGDFQNAGGAPAARIAHWNGSSWSPLGTGCSNIVRALTVAGTDVIAGGDFGVAGGVLVNRCARWNGTTWAALGTGFDKKLRALVGTAGGEIYAGGEFDTAGGVLAPRIAKWDGTSWQSVAGSINAAAGTLVNALTILTNGDLVAAGVFSVAGAAFATNIARFDGSLWHALADDLNAEVLSLAAAPNGDLIAGGTFTASGVFALDRVARWNGTAWSPLGGGVFGFARTLTVLTNGDVIAGGDFSLAGNQPANRIARWNGSAWSRLSPGFNATVNAVLPLAGDDVYVGGTFTTAGTVAANNIARWNGTSWSPLGTGVGGNFLFLPPKVAALARLPNGNIVAGGLFSFAGGVPANYIARWNGSSWSALGSGMNDAVAAVLVLPNGDLIAGGAFALAGGLTVNNIARWNGASWSPLGTGMSNGLYNNNVNTLALLPNGDIVAGGNFGSAGGVAVNGVARWDGAAWHDLDGGIQFLLPFVGVTSSTVLPDGDLVIGGLFGAAGSTPVANIARWNGSAWSALGTGMNSTVDTLTSLPNGDIIAGGAFSTAGGVAAPGIARWDGSAWSAFGGGTNGPLFAAVRRDDTVYVGGNFLTAGGNVSAYLARIATPCPATAVPYGAACPSSGGSNTFAPDNLPWAGSTFLATGTGLPTFAFVVQVTGFTQVSLPLAGLLPSGQPGCNLLVSLDAIDLLLSNAGTVTTQLTIPNTPSLAGQFVHRQLVPIEVDGSLNFVAITGTNALTLTVGTF